MGAGAAETMATRPARPVRREVEAFMVTRMIDLLLSFATSREAQQEILKSKRLLIVDMLQTLNGRTETYI